ncbi:MAG: indolepyruvate oxidoreductase subunit beta [bacterium]
MSVFNIVIAGVGGQGVLLTSKIIAEAALAQGFDVKQSEVHGMAQRGGSVVSFVRFGDKVFAPMVSEGECDLLLGFEPVETARYIHFLKEKGVVIYNTYRMSSITVSIGAEKYPENIDDIIKGNAKNVFPFSGTTLAVEAGDKRALNVVMMGAAMKYLPFEKNNVLEIIRKAVNKKVVDINLKAFQLGMASFK